MLSVLTQDHFDGLGIQARLLDMVDDALLAQQAIIAGEQDAIGADEAGYRWKYVVMVEIDGSSSIIPHVCGDALDFWHEGIERESAAPVRCDEADVWKGGEEGDDVGKGDVAFAWVEVTDRFATMGENEETVVSHDFDDGSEERDVAEAVALSMGHEFAQADHAGLGAAFEFVYGLVAGGGQQDGHAVDASGKAAHGFDDVGVSFDDEGGIGPAKGEGDGDVDA